MRILLITQVFYPDTVSVSQHLTDLANKLVDDGHQVTVFTSSYPYEEKTHRYGHFENYQGIKIQRLWQSSFGKGNTLSRLFDFLTYYVSITIKLFLLKKNEYDLMVGTTSPPLLSFVGVLVSKIKGIKFHFWVMDLQPELSISSGLIKKGSMSAKVFIRIGNYIIRNASGIISLDRFMTEYLCSRGAKRESVKTIAVWPVMEKTYTGSRMSNSFRLENDFGDRVVIMYSGNHAYVHQLDTLLEAALILKEKSRYLFVFVGGGVRKKDVTEFKIKYNLANIVQLPFQPRENIHNSLGSSDIQVVILGNGQVGYTHPNKVYGAMYIGKPILYIGPPESHVADLINDLDGNISVQHGESQILANKIEALFSKRQDEINRIGQNNFTYANENFHPEVLKQKMLDELIG
jgi:colanic acid biosynthesis glycosyl transferase WcaI